MKVHDELWFRYRDVGIKAFCRVGSGTISREITAVQGYDLFMEAPKKVCVVRHPWQRLLSVWYGMFPGGTMPSRGYPPCEKIDNLIAFLLNQPVDDMEVHTKPMAAQLRGLWMPDDHELITLEDFMRSPPHGIPRPAQHWHKSPTYREPDVNESLKVRFLTKYSFDLALYLRAEKSPLVTGGKQATDDGHES